MKDQRKAIYEAAGRIAALPKEEKEKLMKSASLNLRKIIAEHKAKQSQQKNNE